MLARGKKASGQRMDVEELPRDAASIRNLYNHIVDILESTIKVTAREH